MRNTLADLNNYLFESLERINDDELSEEEFEKEMKRAETTTSVAEAVIKNANLMLNAVKLATENGYECNNETVKKLLG